MKYPALDVAHPDRDLVLAIAHDFSPTAAEDHEASLTIFFTDQAAREAAHRAIVADLPEATVTPRDVDDEDWARRSQQNLAPVTVGRITITPRPKPRFPEPESQVPSHAPRAPSSLTIVIIPSMGFGTGHHATTRLCLAALQTLEMTGRKVVDVGTGSGVLAIAARLLGASTAIGIDYDGDAIRSAHENLGLNPSVDGVTFEETALGDRPLPPADIVTANLTGALLVRSAAGLLGAVAPAGTLIVSGLQSHERDEVVQAFSSARVVWEADEDGWVGLAFNSSARI